MYGTSIKIAIFLMNNIFLINKSHTVLSTPPPPPLLANMYRFGAFVIDNTVVNQLNHLLKMQATMFSLESWAKSCVIWCMLFEYM